MYKKCCQIPTTWQSPAASEDTGGAVLVGYSGRDFPATEVMAVLLRWIAYVGVFLDFFIP